MGQFLKIIQGSIKCFLNPWQLFAELSGFLKILWIVWNYQWFHRVGPMAQLDQSLHQARNKEDWLEIPPSLTDRRSNAEGFKYLPDVVVEAEEPGVSRGPAASSTGAEQIAGVGSAGTIAGNVDRPPWSAVAPPNRCGLACFWRYRRRLQSLPVPHRPSPGGLAFHRQLFAQPPMKLLYSTRTHRHTREQIMDAIAATAP